MKITIGGLPGSGTTTLGRALADRYGCTFISAGDVFRTMAAESSFSLAEFGELCEKDPKVDLLIDKRQMEIFSQTEHIVTEGRLSGWLIPKADLKIWLFAPISCRIARIHSRDGCADLKAAENEVLTREASEAVRYLKYYKIDISSIDPYDLVLNSEAFSVEQLAAIVHAALFCDSS